MNPHIVTGESPLLAYLFGHFKEIKKTKLKQLLKYGSVTVNGRVATSHKHPLKAGDRVDFLTKRSVLQENLRHKLSFPIVYEDEWILVVDKPSGLLSMGTERDKIHTVYHELTAYVRAKSPDGRGRVFIVHRLDRDASGLAVFAKQAAAKLALQSNWKKAVKKYYAIVEGVPQEPSGTIESHLTEDNFRRVYSLSKPGRDSKPAVTQYRIVKSTGRYTLLEAILVTGRKNQIRVHLSDLGYPIAGDAKYGAQSDPAGRLALHAFFLSFKHPITEENKTFESPLPAPLAKLVRF